MRPLIAGILLFALPVAAATKGQLEGVVNINTASPDELQLLSGVGPARVRSIVAYRTKHPFRTVEELVRIKGIGRKMLRGLRPHLVVKGPTTAQSVNRAGLELAAVAPPPPPPLLRRPVPWLPLRAPAPIKRPSLKPPPMPVVGATHCLRGP